MGKENLFRFGIHNCYFGSVEIKGFNAKNKNKTFYSNFNSAIRSVFHSSEIPISFPPSSLYDIRIDLEDGILVLLQNESSSEFF